MRLPDKHLLLLSLAFFLIQMQVPAQDDSHAKPLKQQYKADTEDTAKIRLLFQTGDIFMDGPSDSLTFYYEKALELIRDRLSQFNKNPVGNKDLIRKFRRYELRACIEIGIVYKNQGKYDSAILYSEKALANSLLLDDSSWTAVCYANLGTVYLKKGYFSLAQNNYLRALKTFEALGQSRRMAACYLNMGKIYAAQNDFGHALTYYSLSLKNARQSGNKMNKADCYLSMGEAWLHRQQPERARNYLDSALLTLNASGYSHGMDDCFTFLGHSWKQQGRYDKAGEYYQKSLKLSKQEGDLPGMAESFNNLAGIEDLKNKLPRALSYANQSLDNALKSGNLEALRTAWEMQASIHEALGNDKKALAAFKNYSAYKDSLFSESKYRSIREAETRFETKKKEPQLALMTERNEVQQLKLSRRFNLLLASGAGIILIFIISYLIIRQNRIKSQQRAVLLEQRLLRSQMNPHFIFNSLIAIQSYIYKREPLVAGDYLAKFADLVRFTLEHSRVEFVLLSDELKMLTAYLDLQVLRFENKFDYQLSTFDKPEDDTLMIPPMFAQPFVENAIEHGLRHKKEKGHLKVTYSLKNNSCIEISIGDDGVGREKALKIEKKAQHRSRAIEITKDRLSVLSKKYKRKFRLEVTDLKDENGNVKGTGVKITLPLQLSENH